MPLSSSGRSSELEGGGAPRMERRMPIHPTAVIDSRAHIAADVEIGPYTIIDGPVRIGAGTVIGPHCHILGSTVIGPRCRLHANCVIGDFPQDRAFTGGESFCRIGSDNIFREHVTIHRGTKEGTETVVGDRCMFLASAHVAHNCVVGNDVTLVNGSMLGGYVHVGDRAVLSGNVGVHQFCRVGELAMVGGLTYVRQDAPPFFMYDESGYCAGINAVGLRRAGFTPEERAELKVAYRRLYRTPGTWTDAVTDLALTIRHPAGRRLIEFLQAPSKRGFLARGVPRGQSLEIDEPAAPPPILRLRTDLEAA